MGKRYFGNVRKLPSGRLQARYTGPDGRTYSAPVTFDSKQYADAWLARVSADVQTGRWQPPREFRGEQTPPPTSASYAKAGLAGRDLAGLTRGLYGALLDQHILPAFGDMPLAAITPAMVREWNAGLAARTGP